MFALKTASISASKCNLAYEEIKMKIKQEKTIEAIVLLVLVCVTAFFLAGCCTVKEECAAPPEPQCVEPGACEDECVTWQKVTDKETLVVGQQYKYEIILTNDKCGCGLTDFVVTEMFSPNFKFVKSIPSPSKVNSKGAEWFFGDVKLNETKKITIWGTPKASGKITNCTKIDYKKKICNTVNVIAPKLKLTKSAPKEVSFCDPIPITLSVCSTGTGTVNDVKIVDQLPNGLVDAESGKSTVTFTVDALEAGKCEKFTYNAKAVKTGSYSFTATATSKEKLTDKASVSVKVVRAILKIAKSGTKKAYVGRPYVYTITVRNVGDTPATNLRIVDSIPRGAKCISLSKGGVISGDSIVWDVKALQQQKTITRKASFISQRVGTAVNSVAASADCAVPVRASAETEIIGIPAILLEVVDLQDPLAVGDVETYVITVTNQGSAPGTNIKVVCPLEKTQKYVSGRGTTTVTAKGSIVTCAPCKELEPGAKAVWYIKVKALKAGDVRFKAIMTSDQLSRPVQETEATNQY